MKVINVEKSEAEIVYTDEREGFNIYVRKSHNEWYHVVGDEYIPVWSFDDLEKSYKEWYEYNDNL